MVIAEQAAAIEELSRANAELLERVRALERALGRNSGNSSMPPSSDDLPGRTKPARRAARGSGRKRGKQKGAPGSSLAWVDTPDEYVPHRPEGDCACGADLGRAIDVGIERSHQVHDLPEIEIKVFQHDLYRVRCGCGREHVAALPDQVSPARSSYGLNIKSLVVYLLVYQHVPVDRVVKLIADVTGGTGPSVGFCHGMLTRTAHALTDVLATIKSLITLSRVVGFDETVLRAGPAGAKRYVLSASTDRYALFHLGGRDLESFTAFGILPDFAGIAVHDRYTIYYHQKWKQLGGHQACTAHLLRDLTDPPRPTPQRSGPSRPNARCAG